MVRISSSTKEEQLEVSLLRLPLSGFRNVSSHRDGKGSTAASTGSKSFLLENEEDDKREEQRDRQKERVG